MKRSASPDCWRALAVSLALSLAGAGCSSLQRIAIDAASAWFRLGYC